MCTKLPIIIIWQFWKGASNNLLVGWWWKKCRTGNEHVGHVSFNQCKCWGGGLGLLVPPPTTALCQTNKKQALYHQVTSTTFLFVSVFRSHRPTWAVPRLRTCQRPHQHPCLQTHQAHQMVRIISVSIPDNLKKIGLLLLVFSQK